MELTDKELRERLLAFGYAPPPITSTSRKILLKKLESLETGRAMKSSNESESYEEDDTPDTGDHQFTNAGSINSARYRSQKSNFVPENIGMYSRCFARHADFFDRIGFFGTALILVVASVIVFFVFITVMTWNDRRYQSIDLTNAVLPKCSQGGVAGMTCIPDNEMPYTLDHLNTIRSAIHEATVQDRCGRVDRKSDDFLGIFPLFKDSEVIHLLVQNHNFKESEAESLLRNAKVIFKMNPGYEIKWLNEGILYRNHKLLRTCNYVGWNDSIVRVVAYAVASFMFILFTYKTHRWVNRLRSEGDQVRRRLIRDIIDLLKQNQKFNDTNYLSVTQVRDWILSAVNIKPKLWDEVMRYIQKHDTGIRIEKRSVHGRECDVFSLQN